LSVKGFGSTSRHNKGFKCAMPFSVLCCHRLGFGSIRIATSLSSTLFRAAPRTRCLAAYH
jgi:hypothetical protein